MLDIISGWSEPGHPALTLSVTVQLFFIALTKNEFGVEVSLIVSHYLLLYFVTFSLFSYDEGSLFSADF